VIESELARAFSAACEQGGMFSGAFGLIRDGRMIAAATGGSKGRGGGDVDHATVFEIGSITKFLTALCATRLANSNVVAVEDPIIGMLPGVEFDDLTGRDISLGHLLKHSSGLPSAGRDWGPREESAIRRFVTEDLIHHRFHARPGEVGCYSSTAFSLSGLVLESAFGSPFAEILRTEILDPAGMVWAGFPDQVDQDRIAWPHSMVNGEWVPERRLADNPSGYPSGFLLASIDDLVGLLSSILNGVLIDSTALESLLSEPVPRWVDHAPSALAQAGAAWGMGCFTGSWNGQRVIRHGGGQLTSYCSVDLFPESRSGLVLLTNGADDATMTSLLELGYAAIAGPSPRPVVPEAAPVERGEPSGMIGSYLDVDTGRQIEILADDRRLVFRDDAVTAPLMAVDGGRWMASSSLDSWIPIGIPPGQDPVRWVSVWGGLYLRTEVEQWDPGPAALAGAARYRDSFWPDASTDIVVATTDDAWAVTMNGHTSNGRWIGPQRLVTNHGLIEFTPDWSELVLGHGTRFLLAD